MDGEMWKSADTEADPSADVLCRVFSRDMKWI
jgi:hypothetical protein